MALSYSQTPTMVIALVVLWLLFPSQMTSARSVPHQTSSSTSRAKTPLKEQCCFLSSAGCTRKLAHKTRRQASSSLSENQPLHPMMDSNECEFNLQKARLMARFSSVAYEDPPKSRNAMAAGTEQFLDRYGVSITRPIPQSDKNSHQISRDPGTGNDTWNMAHSQAMSPRPLMPMLSGCNASGMSESEKKSLERAQFQWVALATSQTTSAQFDAWRISPGDGSDAILVIAFRGTRLSSYLDLLTDIQLKQDMINCSDFGGCMDGSKEKSIESENKDDSKIMAHSGFLQAYTSIRSSMFQLLSDNAGSYGRIWFTGHSLGAGMATLAVVDVGSIMNGDSQSVTMKSESSSSTTPSDQNLNIPKVKSISSYLFGTPRVGNRMFADRLARLQNQSQPIVQDYYRINTSGDAVVFLPRGKVVNRLDIDYVHAGASVFLPAFSSDGDEKDSKTVSRKMMQLEEDTIQQINQRIFDDRDIGGSISAGQENSKRTTAPLDTKSDNRLSKIRIYPIGDQPPDPLSEIDPEYSGFFPMDPRTWTSSNFQNFVLGEAVRSFRILRGGFVKNHQLKTYEDGLCLASQGDVLVVDQSQ